MKKPIKIVFFYTVVVHYVVALLKALKAIDRSMEITLVYYDEKKPQKSQYIIPYIEGVNVVSRSTLDRKALYHLLVEKNPDILYVSGWVDKEYIGAAKKFKKTRNDIKVVNGIDDQWIGSLRQRVGVVYFKLFYRSLFDYFWISGKPQYSYAQRFGYAQEKIIYNLLSADSSIFNAQCSLSKRFVFLGRFVREKGLDILLEAYNSLEEKEREEWPLYIIGDGPLRGEVKNRKTPQVKVLPFLQPTELRAEIEKGGVLCLPSRFEAWGLVAHELALSGFPLIISSACGAASEFLIDGYNGFLYKNSSAASLKACLERTIALSQEELEKFSERSRQLASRINSELSAYSLISILRAG